MLIEFLEKLDPKTKIVLSGTNFNHYLSVDQFIYYENEKELVLTGCPE